MPRQIDLRPTNKVANNPNNRIAATPDQIANYFAELPALIAKAFETAILEILQEIDALTGLNLVGFAQDLGKIFSGDILGGLLGMVTDTAGSIASLIEGIGGTVIGDVVNVITGFISFLANLPREIAAVLNHIPIISTILRFLGLTSSSTSGGTVSAGSLTTAQPNLLPVPIFSPDSITLNPDWVTDSSSERTVGNGSVKVVATGHPKALRSGSDPTDVIVVGAGQTITATIYVENQGYVGVINEPAVELQFAQFTTAADGTQVLASDFATLSSYTPTGDLAWPGYALTGNYAVPQGVTGLQLRLFVSGAAQAGTFHFADGVVTRTVDTSVIPGLPGALQFINGGIQTLVDTIVSVVRGIPVIGAGIADVIEAFRNFNPLNIVGTLGSELLHGDLTGIVNTLFAAIKKQPVANTDASLADLYNAMSQLAHNTAGSDVTDFADTTTVIPVDPSWANYIDVVIIGEGQDGENGLIFNFFGQGGQPGVTNVTMWVKGTHYDGTLTGVTITVNSNGSITAAIPGHSITAARGSGSESPHFGSGWPGIGPGGIDFNGAHYAGGGNQNTPGANGLGPGGGGAGGNGTLFQPGGRGAPAGAWVRRRTSAVTGQASGADTTPPSAPTVTVDEVTYSAITLTPSGSVDA